MAKVEKITIEWRDPPPRGHGTGQGKWRAILQPLVDNPGRWAMIASCDDADKAEHTAGNLRSRRVLIPHPEHDWEFISRVDEVFAIYHGRTRNAGVRRAKRKA